MEPALAQFESKYAKKVNFVSLDVDDSKNPINRKYSKLGGKEPSLPLTVWVNAKGKVLDTVQGQMSAGELGKHTDKLIK